MSKKAGKLKKLGNNSASVENTGETPKRVKKDFYDKKSFDNPNERECNCGSGESWVNCQADSSYCG